MACCRWQHSSHTQDSLHSITDAFAPAMAIGTHFICLIFHDDGEYGVCICCFHVLTTYQNLHSFTMTWLSLNTPSFTGSMSIQGLPYDSPSLEIGEIRVILDRCGRFLIVDPNGLNPVCQKTTYLDKAFMKTLGGDVRFGTHFLLRMRRNSN